MNFYRINFRSLANSKMNARIRTRLISSSTEDIHALTNAARYKKNFCTDGVARTLRAANQLQRKPMVIALENVAKHSWRAIEIVNDNVDLSIIEEIAECCATRSNYVCQPSPDHRRHLFK